MYDGLHVEITDKVVGCAIEVHRQLGPGLLESVYESASCIEFAAAQLAFKRQIEVPLFYKGQRIAEHRPDLVVADVVIIEIRSVQRLDPIHIAQMLTYLRVTQLRVGLILTFNSPVMKQGI